MAVNKAKRLSKIVREFNLGMDTVVEFLGKKGFSIDPDPNAKVPQEAYDALSKEFSSEKTKKQESEKLTLKRVGQRQSVSITDLPNSESDQKEEQPTDSDDVVLIKDSASLHATPAKEESVASDERQQKTKHIQDFKVVGKIELDKGNSPKETPKVEVEPPVVEPEPKAEVPAEKPVIEPAEPKVEQAEEPVIVAKIDQQTPEESTSPKVEAAEVKKVEAPKEEISEPVTLQIPREETPTQIEEASNTPPVKRDVIESEPGEIKVVGKIDLSTINQRTRPPKKTRKQREQERREKEQERKAEFAKQRSEQRLKDQANQPPGETPQTKSGEETYKPTVRRLNGPTVVGKIDLPGNNDKKKPVASSSDDKSNKKKKRKRIHKDGTTETVGSPVPKKRVELRKDAKPGVKPRVTPRQEVAEEDVQKQIKQTLARLTSGKAKGKGAKYRREKRDVVHKRHQEELEQIEKDKNTLKVTEFVSVNELATLMSVPVIDVISTCMNLGVIVSINQRLDAETLVLVADEFNYKVEFVSVELQEAIAEEEDKEDDLTSRPPIVTVMGHVDHGKTKLLDYVRSANVVAGEAGGITQHIGAYGVKLEDGRQITFLDTPGHEAFTAMRARGAQITDVAIIVVAADDGVMPQTREAINHASAAGVPMVFAINKIDKDTANPERIKEELASMNYLVEDWGGKYQSQEISAKSGINIDELLEKVLLEAEMLDLKANASKHAVGTVVESSLDKGRGYVTTVLVQAGTLKIGDPLLSGVHHGRVKAMYNERGKRITEAGPSTPVLLLGLNGAPQAGEKFNVLETEKEIKEIANKREQLQREQGLRTQKHITLDEIGRRIAIGNFQELNVIVKGDVDGSIEALSDSLIKLSTEEIQVNVIHKAVGQISETDINLASASNAIVIGFQVRPSVDARRLAEKEEIDVRLYSIIYDAIDELKDAMEGMLSPEIREEITGSAEIQETFKITKVGTIAGCIIKEGRIKRDAMVRVIRDGIVVYTGHLASLKRFKDDVKEVKNGFECGLSVDNYNDIKVGDMVEAYEETEVKKTLK